MTALSADYRVGMALDWRNGIERARQRGFLPIFALLERTLGHDDGLEVLQRAGRLVIVGLIEVLR